MGFCAPELLGGNLQTTLVTMVDLDFMVAAVILVQGQILANDPIFSRYATFPDLFNYYATCQKLLLYTTTGLLHILQSRLIIM
jgi:hypothetical protein